MKQDYYDMYSDPDTEDIMRLISDFDFKVSNTNDSQNIL